MKLRKWLPLLLMIVTALVAVIYISGRETVPEGTLAVDTKGETVYVSLAELTAEEISTTLTDAKGEEHSLEAKGVWLSAVLEAAGVDMSAGRPPVLDGSGFDGSVLTESVFLFSGIGLSVFNCAVFIGYGSAVSGSSMDEELASVL